MNSGHSSFEVDFEKLSNGCEVCKNLLSFRFASSDVACQGCKHIIFVVQMRCCFGVLDAVDNARRQ